MSWSLRSRSMRSAVSLVSQEIASWPELAVAVAKPSRVKDFSTRRKSPASSSTTKMRAGTSASGISGLTWSPAAEFRDLDQADEQTELRDGLGESIVTHGLDDVVIATQFVAARHFAWIVGRGQHADRQLAQ